MVDGTAIQQARRQFRSQDYGTQWTALWAFGWDSAVTDSSASAEFFEQGGGRDEMKEGKYQHQRINLIRNHKLSRPERKEGCVNRPRY